MTELVAYMGVAALVIVTPGPDTALTIRNALLGGRRAGTLTAAGVATGQLCWTVAAAAGVTAVLLASEPLFVALKLAGGAYLCWLGIQALRSAISGRVPEHGEHGQPLDPRRAYRQGLTSNLANPKMAAFFTGLLPGFAGGAHPSFAAMLGLGAIFCVLTFVWLAAYSAAVDRAAGFLSRTRVMRWIEGLTGAVLLWLGVRVATASPR